MALTVYEAGNPAKTYEADETALDVGVCMDVLRLVRADVLLGGGEEAEGEIVRQVVAAFFEFTPVVKRVFPGMTDEEYRHCLPRDVGAVMMGIVTFAMTELMQVGDAAPSKKTRRRRRATSSKPSSRSSSRSPTASRP